MLRHLTPADYTTMPWANGQGTTVEMVRVDRAEGGILLRFSMANVTEDGPFSRFPGVTRSLTVIDGPGFTISGDGVHVRADLLVPVNFPGEAVVRATGVKSPSRDVNVMTWDGLAPPRVKVRSNHEAAPPPGGVLALVALAPLTLSTGQALGLHDLVLTDTPLSFTGGPALVVALALPPLALGLATP
jgi:uncharacterized protein